MQKFAFLHQQLEQLSRDNLLRNLSCIDSAQGPIVRFYNDPDTQKVLFCSNDYLNLASDPAVIDAVIKAVKKYGCAAAASRLISGTMTPHLATERSFAEFFRTESALLFSSGWCANEAVIKTLPQKGDIVMLDKFDHASILDAAKAGNAEFRTFHRDKPTKLEKFLSNPKYNRKFIITESIFSMDGDTADLKMLVDMKNAHDAILIVDEAHALGCLGKNGAGLAEELGLLDEIDIIIAPLGKAIAATGAIVASRKIVIDYLINKARAFIYTTASSPANAAAISASLQIVISQPQRRAKLTANAEYLRQKLNNLGLNTGKSTTHIIPVIIGDPEKTMTIARKLYDKGFFAAAVRPPTVPKDSARLRISLQANHTKQQLDSLIDAFSEIL